MNLSGVPEHELFANSFLLESEIADTLRDDWGIAPREIVSLLSEKPRDVKSRLLASMLSGPIDVDKMDYLMRDSLHAGVPYGRNFDQQRLIGSLCVNEAGDGLAISEKGRTAAEMMVFARYVMFSEVYWHHAVRCATAMLQRAFFLLRDQLDLDTLFRHGRTGDDRSAAGGGRRPARCGTARRPLRPRAATLQTIRPIQCLPESGAVPAFGASTVRLSGRCVPRIWPKCSADNLARAVAAHEVLFDAPPVKLEVQFNVQIHFPKESCYRSLGDVSPVVKTLAQQQFDDYVKRVRIFVHPRLVPLLERVDDRAN